MQTNPERDAWVERARRVRIEDEIARRDINLKASGIHHVGPCPRCGGTDRFSINTRKQVFRCRGCCEKGGDVIAFVEWLDGATFDSACEALTREPPPKRKANGAKLNGAHAAAQDHPQSKKVKVESYPYTD